MLLEWSRLAWQGTAGAIRCWVTRVTSWSSSSTTDWSATCDESPSSIASEVSVASAASSFCRGRDAVSVGVSRMGRGAEGRERQGKAGGGIGDCVCASYHQSASCVPFCAASRGATAMMTRRSHRCAVPGARAGGVLTALLPVWVVVTVVVVGGLGRGRGGWRVIAMVRGWNAAREVGWWCLLLAECLLACFPAWCCCCSGCQCPQRSTAQRPQREQETRPVPVDATAPAGARTVQNRSKSMCQCAAVMRSMPQRQWGVVSSGAARADNGCDGGICLNFQLKHDANTRD